MKLSKFVLALLPVLFSQVCLAKTDASASAYTRDQNGYQASLAAAADGSTGGLQQLFKSDGIDLTSANAHRLAKQILAGGSNQACQAAHGAAINIPATDQKRMTDALKLILQHCGPGPEAKVQFDGRDGGAVESDGADGAS